MYTYANTRINIRRGQPQLASERIVSALRKGDSSKNQLIIHRSLQRVITQPTSKQIQVERTRFVDDGIGWMKSGDIDPSEIEDFGKAFERVVDTLNLDKQKLLQIEKQRIIRERNDVKKQNKVPPKERMISTESIKKQRMQTILRKKKGGNRQAEAELSQEQKAIIQNLNGKYIQKNTEENSEQITTKMIQQQIGHYESTKNQLMSKARLSYSHFISESNQIVLRSKYKKSSSILDITDINNNQQTPFQIPSPSKAPPSSEDGKDGWKFLSQTVSYDQNLEDFRNQLTRTADDVMSQSHPIQFDNFSRTYNISLNGGMPSKPLVALSLLENELNNAGIKNVKEQKRAATCFQLKDLPEFNGFKFPPNDGPPQNVKTSHVNFISKTASLNSNSNNNKRRFSSGSISLLNALGNRKFSQSFDKVSGIIDSHSRFSTQDDKDGREQQILSTKCSPTNQQKEISLRMKQKKKTNISSSQIIEEQNELPNKVSLMSQQDIFSQSVNLLNLDKKEKSNKNSKQKLILNNDYCSILTQPECNISLSQIMIKVPQISPNNSTIHMISPTQKQKYQTISSVSKNAQQSTLYTIQSEQSDQYQNSNTFKRKKWISTEPLQIAIKPSSSFQSSSDNDEYQQENQRKLNLKKCSNSSLTNKSLNLYDVEYSSQFKPNLNNVSDPISKSSLKELDSLCSPKFKQKSKNESTTKVINSPHTINSFHPFSQKQSEKILEKRQSKEFSKLLDLSFKRESKAINIVKQFYDKKREKNEDLLNLLSIIERDRPIARLIRERNFSLSETVKEARDLSEADVKKLSKKSEDQQILYKQLISKLLMKSNSGDDMKACIYIMNGFKRVLEDLKKFTDGDFLTLLREIEFVSEIEYNQTSCFLVQIFLNYFHLDYEQLYPLRKLFLIFKNKHCQFSG